MQRITLVALAILLLGGCNKYSPTTPVDPDDPTPDSTGVITGSVTLDGSPFSGVTISLAGPQSATLQTTASGTFTFAGILPGAYTVAVGGFDGSRVSFSQTQHSVTVTRGDTSTISFAAVSIDDGEPTAPGPAIAGTVYIDENSDGTFRAADDTPLQDVAVSLTGQESFGTSTNGEGEYQFLDLSRGVYRVCVTNPNPATLTFAATCAEVTINTTATFTARANFPATRK